MSNYPSEQLDKFMVRMPDGLRDAIKDAAKRNNRSANAEIVARLESSFEADQELAPILAAAVNDYVKAEVARRLRAIAAHLGEAS